MCLVMAALAQPHLVWCFESSGEGVLEINPLCCSFQSSAAADPVPGMGSPNAQSCGPCFDVSIPPMTLDENSSATEAALKVRGAHYAALVGFHSELSFIPSYAHVSFDPHRGDRFLSAIQSTVLLI